MRISSYALMIGTEPNALRVCEHCLWAIESREGNQRSLLIHVDEEDDEGRCDWCGEIGFDVLYEI